MFDRDALRALMLTAMSFAACTEAVQSGSPFVAQSGAGSGPTPPPSAATQGATSSSMSTTTSSPTRAAAGGNSASARNDAADGSGTSARNNAAGGSSASARNDAAGGSGSTDNSAAVGGAGDLAAGGAGQGTTGGGSSTAGTTNNPTMMTGTPGAAAAGSGGRAATGTCCPDGDCLCHGPDPSRLTVEPGPYRTERSVVSSGTLHYPADAEPPLAAIALCGGFLNTGPEMDSWGPFYASHGIVTVIVATDGADIPDIRATRLLAAIDELKALNSDSSSPLANKLSGRYGTSGYSMGGGGTTLAAAQTPELKTSVGLAAWCGTGTGVKVPTLLLCGDADTVAPCDMSEGAYAGMDDSTPKILITISGVTHFDWFGPGDAGRGISGSYALAFQKVYLEGDTRWKQLLLEQPATGSLATNLD